MTDLRLVEPEPDDPRFDESIPPSAPDDHESNGKLKPGQMHLDVPPYVFIASDEANGLRLVANFGSELRHCSELGWFAWSGKQWEPENKTAPRIVQRLTEIGHALLAEACRLFELASQGANEAESKALKARAKEFLDAGLHCQNHRHVAGILGYTATFADIDCKPNIFDQNIWLLNVENGTVDLRTGIIRPHEQADFISKIVRIRYVPDASCAKWIKFLGEVFVGDDGNPDQALIDWIQRWFGYCLTGSNDEQCLVIFHGGGANGKSTLLETVRWIIAEYAAHTPTDTLLTTKHGRGTDNDLARLRGVRMVTAIETAENRKLDEQRAKQLTGKDTVTARFLFKEFFDFTFTAKINFAVNDRPRIDGTDHGIWRRLRVIPMLRQFAEHEKIPDLDVQLREEAEGILAWLVEGARDWCNHGLGELPVVAQKATTEYRDESNPVAQFVAECCKSDPGYSCKTSALLERYNNFAKAQNRESLSAGTFGKRLAALGFGSQKRGNKNIHYSIGLMLEREDAEEASESPPETEYVPLPPVEDAENWER